MPVEPKAFRVLLYLLWNPGRVVTKEEILESVWNDCSVSDNSLYQEHSHLYDDCWMMTPANHATSPTIPTVGYRFVCPVEVIADAHPAWKKSLVQPSEDFEGLQN